MVERERGGGDKRERKGSKREVEREREAVSCGYIRAKFRI